MHTEHFDVLIVGAGLSGIAAAYHLKTRCPGKSFAILEARGAIGGTWDLFRYPGVRSDSDMHTLGFPFRPWRRPEAIAEGGSILAYLQETAREFEVDRKVRLQHRVVAAAWTTGDSRWTLEVERGPERERVQLSCNFLFACSGYYDYDAGYTPSFPGIDRFTGPVIHPQRWTRDIDCQGKRVVVIGSGATAVTLVPSLAQTAAHVTMLQRSPTYIVSLPQQDALANWLRARLPDPLAHDLVRWKNVLLGMLFYTASRRAPARIKNLLIAGTRGQLPAGYDVHTHFTPRYNPWDQRLCLIPNGDLFREIRDGRVEVVTDEIESFTTTGITLRSGRSLQADLIVTATGLQMVPLGKIAYSIDGQPHDARKSLVYKGMMCSDMPNFAIAMGYTNASWTLKVDLTCRYVCRLLNHMDAHGYTQCTPRRVDPSVREQPLLDFTSGYVLRAVDAFPRQGHKAPWRVYQNYALDFLTLTLGSLRDPAMEFRSGKRA